jgi:hypothetical protein
MVCREIMAVYFEIMGSIQAVSKYLENFNIEIIIKIKTV